MKIKRVVSLVVACMSAAGLELGLSQLTFAAGVDNKDEVFQMEGNATDDSMICFSAIGTGTAAAPEPATATPVAGMCPTAGVGMWNLVNFAAVTEDWDVIFAATPPGMGATNADAHSFESDPSNTGTDNAFLGTSSKDTDDLSAWTWKQQKPQAKDDAQHAMAAAYQSLGKTYLYVAIDRIANNGASTAGFQLIQDSNFAMCTGVGTDTDGPNAACTASGTFVGHHIDNDLLIVSDFTIGGAVPIINIFVWNSGYPSTPDVTVSPAPCDPFLDNASVCGITNNHVIETMNNKGDLVLEEVNTPTGGWTFLGKGGNTTYLTGEFLEIGVILDDIFPEGVPCFSKFIGETRSSNSITSSLSDVTAPVTFPLCSISVSKTCNSSEIIAKTGGGEAVRYRFSGNINNTGSATVYNPHLKDTVPSMSGAYIGGSLEIPPGTSRTPGVIFEFSSGSIAGGMSLSYTGQLDSNVILSGTGDSVKNFMDATASSDSSGTPQNVTSESTANWGNPNSCAPPVAPGLTLEKKCNTCLPAGANGLDVDVVEGIRLCNTGNVTLSSFVVKDCRGGSWSSNDPSSATCSGTVVDLSSSAPSSLPPTGMTCAVISVPFTPADCDDRTGSNCGFNDSVIASGVAGLTSATVKAPMPVGASCNVCPINDSCTDYTLGNFDSL